MLEERTTFHRIIVPALDVLIGDPDILMPGVNSELKAEKMIIPTRYIQKIGDFCDEANTARSESARECMSHFREILRDIHENKSQNEPAYLCANGMQIAFQDVTEDEKLKLHTVADYTLAVARRYKAEHPNADLAVMTGQDTMASRAYLEKIDVAMLGHKYLPERRILTLPDELFNNWFGGNNYITDNDLSKYFPNEPKLSPNDFVVFNIKGYEIESIDFTQRIGRYEYDEETEMWCLKPIHYIDALPKKIWPRTIGQAMFYEALLAPAEEIPIVISASVFGTGKTFCAVAAGMEQTDRKGSSIYDEIFVVPRDSQLGKDVGYLPGGERDKTIPKAMPIIDNLKSYLKLTNRGKERDANGQPLDINALVQRRLDRFFQFVPIVNMGGRSLPNAWIIYDEAQDLERFQMKQLMSRIGDGSKMIIIGDPTQINNKHLSRTNNGITYAASKLAGHPYAAIVVMHQDEITRSEAARVIAEIFN